MSVVLPPRNVEEAVMRELAMDPPMDELGRLPGDGEDVDRRPCPRCGVRFKYRILREAHVDSCDGTPDEPPTEQDVAEGVERAVSIQQLREMEEQEARLACERAQRPSSVRQLREEMDVGVKDALTTMKGPIDPERWTTESKQREVPSWGPLGASRKARRSMLKQAKRNARRRIRKYGLGRAAEPPQT